MYTLIGWIKEPLSFWEAHMVMQMGHTGAAHLCYLYLCFILSLFPSWKSFITLFYHCILYASSLLLYFIIMHKLQVLYHFISSYFSCKSFIISFFSFCPGCKAFGNIFYHSCQLQFLFLLYFNIMPWLRVLHYYSFLYVLSAIPLFLYVIMSCLPVIDFYIIS